MLFRSDLEGGNHHSREEESSQASRGEGRHGCARGDAEDEGCFHPCSARGGWREPAADVSALVGAGVGVGGDDAHAAALVGGLRSFRRRWQAVVAVQRIAQADVGGHRPGRIDSARCLINYE